MSFEWRSIYPVLVILIFITKADGELSDSSLNFLHSKQKFEVLPEGQVSLSCRVEDGSAKVFLRHRFTPDTPEYRVHANGKVVQHGQDFLITNIGYHDNGLYYCLAILPDGRQAMKEIAEVVVINRPSHVLNPAIHPLLLVCIGGMFVGFFVTCVVTILLILKQKGIIFKSLTQRLKEEAEKTAKQFKRGRRTTKSGSIWSWHDNESMSSGTGEEVTDYNDLPFIIRHSKIKEKLKTKPSTGSSPPPVPQTPRPVLKMAGPSQPSVPQNLLPLVSDTPKTGMIKAGFSQSAVPQAAESEVGGRMASLPVRQTPGPGTTVTGSPRPSVYNGSRIGDDSSMEHSYDQVPTDEIIYEDIEEMNISSEEK